MIKKIIIGSLVAATVLMADPFASAPGTKAKGMGYAFTAIANNNSAMYYNPAGLTNFDSDKEYFMFSAEVGSGPNYDPYDEDGDNATRSDGSTQTFDTEMQYFLGFASQGAEGFHGGVALYSLYSINKWAFTNHSKYNTDTSSYANVEQDMSILSGSLAYALIPKSKDLGFQLSAGLTLGWAFSGAGLMEYTTEDQYGNTESNLDDAEVDGSGMFYSLGLKARVLDKMQYKIDLGFSYRSDAELEKEDLSTNPFVPMNLPSETRMGVAGSYLSEYGVLTGALDYTQTGYADATEHVVGNSEILSGLSDYTMTSMGVDFSAPRFQVRGGYYSSTADDVISLDNMTGFTFGAGLLFDNGVWNMEAAVDSRTYAWVSGQEDEVTSFTVSLNYALGR